MTATDIRDDVASAGAPVALGTVIAGRYRVLEQLEGYGVPAGYRVRHTLLDSVLVLTAIPAQRTKEAGFLARVQAVVRQAGQLRHDHILPVLDLVEDGERYFLVEPFVDAMPLDHVIRDQPLAPPDALLVARQLADALAYAHDHGVVHGAVSPANVWIERGRPPRALLGGFGLTALAWNASARTPASLPYTAPERIVGADVDVCTDIFTIGLLVFELFEGRPLLSGTAREVEALLRGTGPLVPHFSGMVPAGVSALVGRAVRRTPGARQQKMAHVRVEIDACLRAVGQATGAAAAPVPPEPAIANAAPAPALEVEAVASPSPARTPIPDAPAAAGPAPSAHTKPAAAPIAARAHVVRRVFWPKRPRREATLSGRLLLHVSEPRQTPLGVRVAFAGMLLALGWPILRWNSPASSVDTARARPVEARSLESAAPAMVASVAEPPPTVPAGGEAPVVVPAAPVHRVVPAPVVRRRVAAPGPRAKPGTRMARRR